jgi:uncharacterized protein YjgD (DUF1641 family)
MEELSKLMNIAFNFLAKEPMTSISRNELKILLHPVLIVKETLNKTVVQK